MKALLLIDLQNDFLPGGALAVAEGDRVVPVANVLAQKFEIVVATQDWHPANHGSFAANHPGRQPFEQGVLAGLQQTLWPVHCVQGTFGAAFADGLDQARVTHVTQKGSDPTIDSYSGFFDNGHRRATDLDPYLKQHNVDHLYVMGLATDYCVKFTVLDGLALGYRVSLIVDGCKGVNLQKGDVDRAIAEMKSAGASIVQSDSLLK